jgi:hypothetical protein
VSVNASIEEARQEGVRAVRVETVFHVSDDQQAQTVAAKMVDRAHEIANLPECECDVDVSIERAQPSAASERLEQDDTAARGQPTKL